MLNMTLFFSDSSKKFYFHIKIYFWGESVFSEDVNPDFVHQSNEIRLIRLLC